MIKNIDDLNMQLFDVIERLKSQNDEDCDKKETISNDTAKTIVEVSKVIISGYRVKADVLKIMQNTENPNNLKTMTSDSGIIKLNE